MRPVEQAQDWVRGPIGADPPLRTLITGRPWSRLFIQGERSMSQSYGRQIRARRAERGAGTLEYVAAFGLAALVVTTALAGLQQGRLA